LKFFTTEWLMGDLSDAEVERAWPAYEAHLIALGPRLPKDARRLWTELSLHDGLVRAVGRTESRLEVIVRAGSNQVGYFDARLAYGDVRLSPIDEQYLRSAIDRRDVELLHDEFDSSGDLWVHSLLFCEGPRPVTYREVSIHFGAFTLAVDPAQGRFT
jgi:hypothetical protein